MSRIIYGDAYARSEAVSGTEYAVCYLDLNQGTFSNASWRAWFPSDVVAILDGSTPGTITFLTPSVQFPYSTHYTVVASDGHIHEYANRAEAIQGFDALSLQEVSNGSAVQAAVPPQLCYYHEVKCPSGMYRLEFFGPRMDEQGYRVREAVASHQ